MAVTAININNTVDITVELKANKAQNFVLNSTLDRGIKIKVCAFDDFDQLKISATTKTTHQQICELDATTVFKPDNTSVTCNVTSLRGIS